MLSKIAVILTDAHRRILWVNQGFSEITGYSLEDVKGHKPSLLQGENTEKDVVQRMRTKLSETIPFQEKITNYRKNGQPYPCLLSIYPIFDVSGKLTNFIAFEMDGNSSSLGFIPLSHAGEHVPHRGSALKEADAKELYQKLLADMENEKPYLIPDLTLADLANRLKTNTKYLSQIINQYSKANTRHFINNYRVEEFIRHLANNQHHSLTLFGLAQQCGFNNKTTFFKSFRTVTGKTPSVFLKGWMQPSH